MQRLALSPQPTSSRGTTSAPPPPLQHRRLQTMNPQRKGFVGDMVELAPHRASKPSKGGRLFVGDQVKSAAPPPHRSDTLHPKRGGGSAGIIVSKSTTPEGDFWEVDAVIGYRKLATKKQYLIRWKGCSRKQNSWEPEENLCDTARECPSLNKSTRKRSYV